MGMLHAAIDIHKHVFQTVTLDPASGELVEARLPATREALTGHPRTPLQGINACIWQGWRP
jgi:hypothetical protein